MIKLETSIGVYQNANVANATGMEIQKATQRPTTVHFSYINYSLVIGKLALQWRVI